MAFKLDPSCPVNQELVRAICEQLARAIELTSNPRTSANERVHRARRSCKKARAALRMVRGLDRSVYREGNRRLRAAAKEFSNLRDAQAITQSLARLLEAYATPAQRKKFTGVRRAVTAHRREIVPSPADFEARIEQFILRVRAIAQELASCSLDDDIRAVVAEFGRSYQQARRALAAAGVKSGGSTFHEWRKATNALTYQCRLLRKVWPPLMKVLSNQLRRLTTCLGDEHDLTVLDATLQELRDQRKVKVDDRTYAAVRALIKTRRRELRATALPLGARVFVDRPRVVMKRMETWWQIARGESRRSG